MFRSWPRPYTRARRRSNRFCERFKRPSALNPCRVARDLSICFSYEYNVIRSVTGIIGTRYDNKRLIENCLYNNRSYTESLACSFFLPISLSLSLSLSLALYLSLVRSIHTYTLSHSVHLGVVLKTLNCKKEAPPFVSFLSTR